VVKHCANCKNDAVVGLNGKDLCLACFEESMSGIGRSIRQVRKALTGQPEGAPDHD